MQSKNKFWDDEKMAVANRCEYKNCRLYYDQLQETYFVVKKYEDGSILHTKETELFKSHSLIDVYRFVKKLSMIIVIILMLASCASQRYCTPSKKSRDYAGEIILSKNI